MIIGDAGSNSTGDIGLDDFSITYEACSHPLACSFETGDLCSWTNSREGGAMWLLTAGSTPSDDTGPAFDHTVGDGSGYYVYTEASFMMDGEFTTLESEPVLYDNDMCITLFYHMWGQGC